MDRDLKVGDVFKYDDGYMKVKGVITKLMPNHYNYTFPSSINKHTLFEFKIIDCSDNWYPPIDKIDNFSEGSSVYDELIVYDHLTDVELLAMLL